MSFSLSEQQQAVVDSRGGALLVSAAAGSGKTRVLVERLLDRVTREGIDIDRFVVITYTKTAAAELRDRIIQELSARIARNPADRHLRRQATRVFETQISTVHAFCAAFLRECGHLLDISPDFALCDQQQSELLLLDTLTDVLEARYERIESDPAFSLLVDTMAAGRDDSQLIRIALEIRAQVQSHPNPAAWLQAQVEQFSGTGQRDAAETLWGKVILEDAARQADYWCKRMEAMLELSACDDILVANYAGSIAATIEHLAAFHTAAETGWDAARDALPIAFPRAGSKKGVVCTAEAEHLKVVRKNCADRMKKLEGRFADSSAQLLGDLNSMAPAIRALVALLEDLEDAYTKEKNRRGLLDFSDLEHLTVRLLRSDAQLAARWSARYAEIMVDEYQDTNEVQNEIFSALSDGGRKLFMVGDVKQSIFRFRLADPGIFLEKYHSFRDRKDAEAGEPRRIILSQNYRSRAEVLQGANDVFRSIMSVECGEMDYTETEALYPGAVFPPGDGYAVELDVLNLKEDGKNCEPEEGEEHPTRDLQDARFTARRIRNMLDEGFRCTDGQGGMRSVTPSDIVILLRAPGSQLPYYTRALGEQDIPWQAEGGDDFFAATEISVALALLQIMDNPRQDVPLISVLRSPIWGFSADRLAELRAQAAEGVDFYTAVEQSAAQGAADCAAFLRELEEMHFHVQDWNCYRLIWEVYDRTNLLGVYGMFPEGERRQENLLALAELARSAEAAGHRGLYGFLRYIDRLQSSGKQPPLPSTGRTAGGVRMMSIHHSKGLEFPVVFLCGLVRKFNRQDFTRPILFHPKLGIGPKGLDAARMVAYPTIARQAVARQLECEMLAEEMRLLYVAMTRAKEKLVLVCALSQGARELQKLAPDAGCPVEPQALLGCNNVAQWILLSVLPRPEAAQLREIAGMAWIGCEDTFGTPWDIRWLDMQECAAPEHRSPRAVTPDTEAETMEDAAEIAARFRWQYPYAAVENIPSKLTVTQLKGRLLDQEIAAEAPKQPREKEPARPRFAQETLGLTPAQKGTALHLAMQFLDYAKTDKESEITAQLDHLQEMQFLSPEQREAVNPQQIAAFFSSALGQRVKHAPSLRREFKFSILTPARKYYPEAGEGEEIMLQGVIDCFIEEADGITVVDFKTDHVYGSAIEQRAEDYRPQLAAYAEALTAMTGKPVARCVLWFFSEGRAIEIQA